ncbi:MAG: hypothetical protein M3252_01090, partial [Actinomycetota bacterium]|nr:hypothetical protein [Actinomycetota bacterium]
MRRLRRRVYPAVLAIGGTVLLGATTLAAVESDSTTAFSSRDGKTFSYQLSHHRDDHSGGPGHSGQVGEDTAEQPAPTPTECPSPNEAPGEPSQAETPAPCTPPPPPPPAPDETETPPPPD